MDVSGDLQLDAEVTAQGELNLRPTVIEGCFEQPSCV
jgi:hypothetical protein